MKRILALVLTLSIFAACGQSEPAATGVEPAATAAGTTAPAAAPATTVSAPAAESHAGHDATPTSSTATAETLPPAAANAAGQPAPSSPQTAPGIMTDPVAAAGFVEGRHFRRISAASTTNPTPGQVEVDEFFMYSCVHCFNLEPYVQAWLPNKPAYINFVRIPTTWNETVKLHAQAFYAAAALGKGEEMHQPFFESMHVDGNYLETQADMRRFFARFGVSDADFNGVFESFGVRSQVNLADDLGRRYAVESTPTIIVAGKYSTGTSEAGSYERLFELIEALAARELQQR